ncbi:heavy-metal-associated domain-containing protein [Streptomyces sp. GQFP]|uniref:heavy-metal-associated domain-containing protein n=1 Tax=Streptomyces sp. GQFP TaxID=2907545 RepID=UPI001F1B1A00|nr:cation transporter [Streptomyces sp. GQFP]UIX29338.1 cation transporter [Streptomyces sp. GQFP]
MSSSCCTPDNSCNAGNTEQSVAIEGVRTLYAVSGMTCGHCKDTLTTAIGALDGVSRVEVDLEAGQVAVISAAEPDDKVIAGVVDDAGYEVTGRAA